MTRYTGCGTVMAVMDGSGKDLSGQEQDLVVDQVARRNVAHSVAAIQEDSTVIHQWANSDTIRVARAIYNLRSCKIEFSDEA